MTPPPTLIDRLRIERAAWTLDARLQDLPRRSRIERRRELRTDLRAAADEVGARQAVRQLGDLRVLAADFLTAEYGELARRPSWTAAAVALLVVDVVMLVLDHVGATAFQAGIRATVAPVNGDFRWTGVPYLISEQTFHYAGGVSTTDGGAWTPWVYVIMVVATIGAGRLWRLRPGFRPGPSPRRHGPEPVSARPDDRFHQ